MFEKMTRSHPLILALTATLLVGACNGKSNSDGGGGAVPPVGNIPDNVNQDLPQAAKLTEAQKDHFITRMKALKGPLLATLVWVDPKETAEDRQRREQELAAAPIDVRVVVDEIKNNCYIQHPTTVTTQPGNEIKPGTTIHSSMSASISQKERACPITATQGNVSDTIITQFDQAAGNLKATITGSVDQNHAHTATNAIAATGLRGGQMHMKRGGAIEYGQGKMITFIRFAGTMTIAPETDADLRMTLDGESRMSMADSKNSSAINVRFAEDGVEYVLSIRITEDGDVKTEDYFLNGDPIANPGVGTPGAPSVLTAAEARSIFQSSLRQAR